MYKTRETREHETEVCTKQASTYKVKAYAGQRAICFSSHHELPVRRRSSVFSSARARLRLSSA